MMTTISMHILSDLLFLLRQALHPQLVGRHGLKNSNTRLKLVIEVRIFFTLNYGMQRKVLN